MPTRGGLRYLPRRLFCGVLLFCALLLPALAALPQGQKPAKLPRTHQLDKDITWSRDPSTGELHIAVPQTTGTAGPADAPAKPQAIQVRTQMVPVTCTVSAADGSPVPGLTRKDFQVFDNGIAQSISYFNASTQPAGVALVIDASPSVLRDGTEMRRAAEELIGALAPLDQAGRSRFFRSHVLAASVFRCAQTDQPGCAARGCARAS